MPVLSYSFLCIVRLSNFFISFRSLIRSVPLISKLYLKCCNYGPTSTYFNLLVSRNSNTSCVVYFAFFNTLFMQPSDKCLKVWKNYAFIKENISAKSLRRLLMSQNCGIFYLSLRCKHFLCCMEWLVRNLTCHQSINSFGKYEKRFQVHSFLFGNFSLLKSKY